MKNWIYQFISYNDMSYLRFDDWCLYFCTLCWPNILLHWIPIGPPCVCSLQSERLNPGPAVFLISGSTTLDARKNKMIWNYKVVVKLYETVHSTSDHETIWNYIFLLVSQCGMWLYLLARNLLSYWRRGNPGDHEAWQAWIIWFGDHN